MFWCATLVLLTLVVLSQSIGENFDWCKHDCVPMIPGKPTEKHTMCRYKNGGGPQCGQYKMGLTKEEKDDILDLHNRLRATVANGLEKRGVGGPQPAAANMMELIWDEELAMIAQRWADQCMMGGHDACRKTMDGMNLGQNVGSMSGYSKNPDRLNMIGDRMTDWYDEVQNLVPSDVDSVFRSSQKPTEQYAQVVWADTTRVGCGLAYLNSGTFAIKLVCNYKPAGILIHKAIYIQGPAASKCPKDSIRSTSYPGLCKASGNDLEIAGTTTLPSSPNIQPLSPKTSPNSEVRGSITELPLSAVNAQPVTVPQTIVTTTPTPAKAQQPLEKKKKKDSLFWRIITLPWRFLKWLFSLPLRLFEAIKNLFN